MKLNNILKKTKIFDPALSLYEYIRIFYLHNSNVEPILIYQMGKVGSSTIYKTLKKIRIENSVYHIHSLKKKGITDEFHLKKVYKDARLPLHLKTSKFLTEKINVRKDKIKVITLTREPVGRIISRFFQNLYYTSPDLIISEDKIDYSKLQDKIQHFFPQVDLNKEDATTWFDREFREALGVDIYSFPFDKDMGYQIFTERNVDCLVIKMERLSEVGCEALNKFLPIDRIDNLINTNIGSEKGFSLDYQKMKKELRFDTDMLNKFYSTKYMTHFYTADEISGFIKKWSQ